MIEPQRFLVERSELELLQQQLQQQQQRKKKWQKQMKTKYYKQLNSVPHLQEVWAYGCQLLAHMYFYLHLQHWFRYSITITAILTSTTLLWTKQ